ncbi:RnfABCDGE type electron transport complex subunit B [Halomonas sp. wenzhen-202101]|uniref:RnfABCDGE type electron transport complex subunit B n=2 Tax=Halomonas dongshanensis TaxID=2890835 RepID=A0ABT2EE40_9GAMM|nr:RnfABCDGE type electron transport complex subunit B [Halomonas dongshanensis]
MSPSSSMPSSMLIDAVDAALPQTQCGKCGFNGCRPYAEAIAKGEPINRCPPGGVATLYQLAKLTGQAPLPLEQPAQLPMLASIREAECIGCTKCIQACPVDAILGAAKQMHTVIETECTGCELCVAPCPVDCIDLLPHPQWQAANDDSERQAYLARRARLGRQRFEARNQRLNAEVRTRQARRARRAQATPAAVTPPNAPSPRQEATTPPAPSRAKRMRLVAAIKRLERQHAEASDAERPTLAERLAVQRQALDAMDVALARIEPNAQASRQASGASQQKRLALKAAEQSLAHVRQQMRHAQRQQDSAAIAHCERQLHEAQQVVNTARRALVSDV